MARREDHEAPGVHSWQALKHDDVLRSSSMVDAYYSEQRGFTTLLSFRIDHLGRALRIPFPLSPYGRFTKIVEEAYWATEPDNVVIIDRRTARRLYKIATRRIRYISRQETESNYLFISKLACLKLKDKLAGAV